MPWLSELVHDPNRISIICAGYIISYYCVAALSIKAVNNAKANPGSTNSSRWKKYGFLDNVTSVTWSAFAILLIWSLGSLAFSDELTLSDLIRYYFLFIFLFAILYGMLDWHWPYMLDGQERDSWKALAEHILVSVQTQTTIGYTRRRPNHLFLEFTACLQALLGIFLLTISIARAVNKLY